jgi:cephalosporin-C deacetylase-like acetyl esterase
MRLTTLALLCAVLLSPSPFFAQGPAQDAAAAALQRWKETRAQHTRPPQDPFLTWMDQIAQRQLQARENIIAEIHTTTEAKSRQQSVHEKLIEIMGGLPNYHGPLNAKVMGHIQAEGYVIEKVVYESLPGFYITANLYRPTQPGRYPAVLLQSGHVQEGKPESQIVAANLALKGFVVLAFDPIGQGEREQAYDRQIDGSVAGWGSMEHMQTGAQSVLMGEGVARFFIWDAMRSTDYLASRPEVDATRIGAAGCSGGGALTTYMGALDPRIKAVASACSTNSYRVMFGRPIPNGEFHAEMALPRFLSAGLDTADFVEVAAPKPWLILATEGDFFTPDGAKLVYDEARHWYSLFGAEDKLRFFVGPGPHGMPLPTREHIYDWMTRWLKDGQGDTHEQPFHIYTNLELLVTPTGHVEDLPGSRKLYQIIREEYRTRKQPGTIPELQGELRRLGIPSEGAAPEVHVVDESNGPGFRQQHLRFESEPGVEIGGELFIPPSPAGRKPAVLMIGDELSPSLAERIARKGCVVLVLKPRDSPWGNDYRPYIGSWLTYARVDHIGLNLPAMRAHDIVRGIDVLAARGDVDPASIRAAGHGTKGIWLLLAAAADSRISKMWLDRTPFNLRSALENTVNIDLLEVAIPNFVLHWDLEDLIKAMGNRPVMWTDPTNWMGRVVALGSPFQYRYVLGDATDIATAQDDAYIEEFLKI